MLAKLFRLNNLINAIIPLLEGVVVVVALMVAAPLNLGATGTYVVAGIVLLIVAWLVLTYIFHRFNLVNYVVNVVASALFAYFVLSLLAGGGLVALISIIVLFLIVDLVLLTPQTA